MEKDISGRHPDDRPRVGTAWRKADGAQEAAPSWSVRGGIKWRAERRRSARDHLYWPSERDAGSADFVPSPPERDRLTSIAVFGLRPQYLFWQVWNFLGGGA
jgi:hypothetical protein